MDVTQEILLNHILYGSSDNTNPGYTSSSKSLQYSQGASIQNPMRERITKIPFEFNFQDTVGLMGAENAFVRIDVQVIDTGVDIIPTVNSYVDAGISPETATINTFETGDVDVQRNQPITNTYEDGLITFGGLPNYWDPRVSVSLKNLGINNQYIDKWLDVRLYTKDKQEFEYDEMYIKPNDYFYVGFHARNTRRLPYNVSVKIGDEYVSSTDLSPNQRRYLS